MSWPFAPCHAIITRGWNLEPNTEEGKDDSRGRTRSTTQARREEAQLNEKPHAECQRRRER